MRELILVRHAHAEPPAAGGDDHARPLSAIGRQEAAGAGDWLRDWPARWPLAALLLAGALLALHRRASTVH